MDFRVERGDLGPKKGIWGQNGILRESGHGIALLAKMGTGKGLLGINRRFRLNGDLGECARKGIRAKMRLIQGKDVVLGKGHFSRNKGFWASLGKVGVRKGLLGRKERF